MVTGGALYKSLESYEKDNYYLKDEQGQSLEPEKIGAAWEKLNAQDIKITEDVYGSLKEGKDPQTGEQLVQAGVNGEHRAGYNQTFSPDKSFTVYAHSSPEAMKQIREIQNKSVNSVMKYFESDLAQARQTTEGITEPVKTGNILAMRVDHQVNRLGDVQLHSHMVIYNQTYNEQTGKWQALHSDAFHSDILTKIYENELAHHAKAAGLAVGWKNSDSGNTQYAALSGVPEKAIEATSERARQVDAYIKEHAAELKEKYPNATEGELKQIAAIETRPEKVSMTHEQIEQQFTERLLSVGLMREDIAAGVQKATDTAKEASKDTIRMNEYEIVQKASGGLAANRSVFSAQDLLKAGAELSRGDVSFMQLQRAIKELEASKDIVRLSGSHTIEAKGGREYNDQVFTTPLVQKEEQYAVNYARQGQGKLEPVMTQEKAQESIKAFVESKQQTQITEGKGPDFALTQDQVNAAAHIATSPDKVSIIIGDSGVGKTTMLSAAKSLLEQEGYKIIGLAPTGQVAKEMGEATGMESMTADKFLIEHAKQKVTLDSKTIIVVDEAGMLGSLKTAAVMHAAEETGARLTLIGDTKQLQSIDQGKLLSDLVSPGAVNPVRMTENIRQKADPEYQQAVRDLAERKIDQAMDRLENNGKVHEISDRARRLAAIKEDYTSRNYKKTVIVTARNADRNELNQAIRETLKEQGKIKGQEHAFTVREAKNIDGLGKHLPQNYQPGDIIQAHNMPGIQNGNELRVRGQDQNLVTAANKDGKEHAVDVRRNGDRISNVYTEKKLRFAVGDKGVCLRNDEGLNVKNGNTFIVKSIDARGNMTVKLANSRELKFNPNTQYNHIDHGYAVSEYKSQGGTWQNVIVHADTSKEITFNAQYVAQSRGKQDMKIYADDKAGLRGAMKHEQRKTSTLDIEKSESRETANSEIRSYELGRETQGLHTEKSNGREQLQADKSLRETLETQNRETETGRETERPQTESAEFITDKTGSKEAEKNQGSGQPEDEKTSYDEREKASIGLSGNDRAGGPEIQKLRQPVSENSETVSVETVENPNPANGNLEAKRQEKAESELQKSETDRFEFRESTAEKPGGSGQPETERVGTAKQQIGKVEQVPLDETAYLGITETEVNETPEDSYQADPGQGVEAETGQHEDRQDEPTENTEIERS